MLLPATAIFTALVHTTGWADATWTVIDCVAEVPASSKTLTASRYAPSGSPARFQENPLSWWLAGNVPVVSDTVVPLTASTKRRCTIASPSGSEPPKLSNPTATPVSEMLAPSTGRVKTTPSGGSAARAAVTSVATRLRERSV